MGFDQRLAVALSFECKVEQFCNHQFNAVARNGTEHTHPGFVDLLRTNNSETSKLVRFAPDGIALHENGIVYHWEAKIGTNIEKDAYQTYMRYAAMGCVVLVFIHNPNEGKTYWNRVESIRFIPSEMVVSNFPPERQHPIDEDGWMHPRRGRGHKSGRASGTPYKTIDFSSLILIPDFDDKLADSA